MPHSRNAVTFWFATLILSSQATQASEEHAEQLFLDDIPIVLTPSRLAQPVREAPVAVTVIDRQMIHDSGAWDLSEVFRLVPGMYVAYHADPYFSADSTVAYHGMVTRTTSDRMQVLIDHRSVYAGLYGGVNWSDLPIILADIERIEVIRGPDSASYGANSFSGVINIITRHATAVQAATAAIAHGKSRSQAWVQYGNKSGDFSYRVSASLRRDDGEDARIAQPASKFTFWTVNKFDNKRIHTFNFRGDYQAGNQDSLEFQFGYNGGSREVGEYNNVSALSRDVENHFAQVHWRHATADNGEVSFKVYHTTERVNALLLDSDGISDGDASFRRLDLEAQHIFSPFENARLVWGASLRYDKTYAPYYLGVGDNRYLYGEFPYHLQRLFANLEWRVHPRLVANLGGMLEHNSYIGHAWTPRVALNWEFTPGHSLRLSHSHATRSPSVYEKVYEGYWRSAEFYPHLPILQNESLYATELGYLGKFHNLEIDARLFRDAYHNLIDVRKTSSAASGNLNAGRALLRGYELQVKYALNTQTRLIYGLSGGGVDSPNANGVIYSDSLPAYSHSLMLAHHMHANWRASLTAYQVAKTKFNATDYNPTQNRGYFVAGNRRLDARLDYRFRIVGQAAEASLIVQNLCDAHYFEYRRDNEFPGRLARLSLKLEF